MARETLDQILACEKAAADRLAAASDQAEQLVAQAHTAAGDTLKRPRRTPRWQWQSCCGLPRMRVRLSVPVFRPRPPGKRNVCVRRPRFVRRKR